MTRPGAAMRAADHTFAVLAYRESPFIDACIESLRRQTVKSRIIIATSTPSRFLDDVGRRHGVPLFVNPEGSRGIAADWNFAYGCCDTEYLTLAHQDDLYLPQYAERCLEKSRSHPSNLIVFTGYFEQVGKQLVGGSLNLAIKKLILLACSAGRGVYGTRAHKRLVLSFGQPIPCPSVMYHARAIGPFQFTEQYAVNLDWDAWLQLSQRIGSFIYLDRKLMVHRLHDRSQTAAGLVDQRRHEEDRQMFLRLWPRPVGGMLSRLYSLAYREREGRGVR